MDYLTVKQAIDTPGMRLVLTAGVPGPWSEAAKSLLRYKSLDFVPVLQEGGGENAALREWTGQTSAPVIVVEGAPVISHWFDLLMFVERLVPEKSLLPSATGQRAEVLGLSALIAGADGFGWNRRLQMLAPMMSMPEPPEMAVRLADKFGWSEQAHTDAMAKLQSISGHLEACLARQQEQGSDYLVGDNVSAADFYWANFAGMVKPLPHADNPMPDYMRTNYQAVDSDILACVPARLEAHRDMMYQRHITLPLDF